MNLTCCSSPSCRCPSDSHRLTVLAGVCTLDAPPIPSRPDDPRMLVRHGYSRPIPPPPCQQPPAPLAPPISFRPRPAQRRPGTVDAQWASVAIAPLTDPQPPGLATRRVLCGYQPDP